MKNFAGMEFELPLPSPAPPQSDRLFAVFLKDHLAVLHGTCALVRRALLENRDDPVGRLLAPVDVAVHEDLLHLQKVAAVHRVRPSFTRNLAATVAEKLGRLKANGRFFGYSPLSRVLELESLLMLTVQRAALWRILQARGLLDLRMRLSEVALDERAELAERQAQILLRLLVREGGLKL